MAAWCSMSSWARKPILGHAPEGKTGVFAPGGYATDGHLATRLLSQGRGLPMGLPSTHRRSRIHSTYRAGPLHRRLHGEPAIERVSGHPRARLRPALRAGLPPRPRRGKAGRHLPPEARRRRSSRRRHHARGCRRSRSSRTARRSRCIGAGRASLTVANDLMPLGYSVTIFEQCGVPGGLMRTNIPSFRLPARSARRRDRADRRHGRRPQLNSPDQDA